MTGNIERTKQYSNMKQFSECGFRSKLRPRTISNAWCLITILSMVMTTCYVIPTNAVPLVETNRISHRICSNEKIQNCYGIQQYVTFCMIRGGADHDNSSGLPSKNNDDSKDLAFIIDSFQEQLSKKVLKYREDTRTTFHKLHEDIVRVITKKSKKQGKLSAISASVAIKNNSNEAEVSDLYANNKGNDKLGEVESELFSKIGNTIVVENRTSDVVNNDTISSPDEKSDGNQLLQTPVINSTDEIEIDMNESVSADSSISKSDDTTFTDRFRLPRFGSLPTFGISKPETKVGKKKSNKKPNMWKQLKKKNNPCSSSDRPESQQNLSGDETFDASGSYFNSIVKQNNYPVEIGNEPIAITPKQLRSNAIDSTEVKKMISALLWSSRSKKVQKYVVFTLLYLVVSILVQIIFKILARRLVIR